MNLKELIDLKNDYYKKIRLLDKQISDSQLIKSEHMWLFGFELKTESEYYKLYSKIIKPYKYDIILDISNPNTIILHQIKDNKIVDTYINSEIYFMEDFREILINYNLI